MPEPHLETTDPDPAAVLGRLKSRVRSICSRYADREQRARRLFIEDRATALCKLRDTEFSLRSEIAEHFSVAHSSVHFCGSTQLGFSVHKDALFEPAISDLDGACVDVNLFQRAWADVIKSTRAFNDLTAFSSIAEARNFKDRILKRGMILVSEMPRTPTSATWQRFERQMSKQYVHLFSRISIAIYMNEYAFAGNRIAPSALSWE